MPTARTLKADIFRFVELYRFWMIGTAHANFVEETLLESGQARNFFAILQVNFALRELRLVGGFYCRATRGLPCFVDRLTCSPLNTK